MADYSQLINSDTQVKVSSTQDKSVGKKYLTDGNPETGWSSQQGSPQFVQFSFASKVVPRKIQIIFQGGFVGTPCILQIEDQATWREWTRIFPADVNRSQTFELPSEGVEGGIDKLKLVFEKSSDFFGRVTLYDIQIMGTVL